MGFLLKYWTPFLFLISTCSASSMFLQKSFAEEFLFRVRRANGGFEEFSKGNLERECFEELCDYEEAREVFEDDLKTKNFWKSYAEVDHCSSSPCTNEATCVNSRGTYSCSCLPGFEGNTCENDIDECFSFPCINKGTCLNHFGSYSCICQSGFYGDNCEKDVNECLSLPCLNNATCKNVPGGYSCTCFGGFEGRNCENEIDECERLSPCPVGAQCVDGINQFTCLCPKDGCKLDINKPTNHTSKSDASVKEIKGGKKADVTPDPLDKILDMLTDLN
uniref:Vitamin K-dependent protein S n=1 Tax=Latimeria chalumnae TaxID=7897 RepID=M3XKV6_LATCH|nr:PREDICTED: fibropellin-3-like [Latimeria chalumnae]|eukprot:XP_014347935.1 PREDICTED: fibropellin-3-like [Latimeria chalumnae]